MKMLLSLIVLLASARAWAAGGSGGHDNHIPVDVIITQCVYVLLTLGVLYYFLNKKLKDHFAEREAQFSELLLRAERAREQAENQKKQISERLAKLEKNADKSIQKAKSEAEELRQKIIREANEVSARLERDAQRTADFEIERAKLELRQELLDSSVEAARSILNETVGDPDQKRLQTEFVSKIQAVR